jgi:hypothetical protein
MSNTENLDDTNKLPNKINSFNNSFNKSFNKFDVKVALDYSGVIHPEFNPSNTEHLKPRNIQRLTNKIGSNINEKYKDAKDLESYLNTLTDDWYNKQIKDGHEGILKLLNLLGSDNVYIISKANQKRQEETIASLEEAGLISSDPTDDKLLKKENIVFIPVVQGKQDKPEFKEKGHATRKLRIDIMIDDDVRNIESFKTFCPWGHFLHYVPFFQSSENPYKINNKSYMMDNWDQIYSYVKDFQIIKQKRQNAYQEFSKQENFKEPVSPNEASPIKKWSNRDGSSGSFVDNIPDKPRYNQDYTRGRGRGRGRGNSFHSENMNDSNRSPNSRYTPKYIPREQSRYPYNTQSSDTTDTPDTTDKPRDYEDKPRDYENKPRYTPKYIPREQSRYPYNTPASDTTDTTDKPRDYEDKPKHTRYTPRYIPPEQSRYPYNKDATDGFIYNDNTTDEYGNHRVKDEHGNIHYTNERGETRIHYNKSSYKPRYNDRENTTSDRYNGNDNGYSGNRFRGRGGYNRDDNRNRGYNRDDRYNSNRGYNRDDNRDDGYKERKPEKIEPTYVLESTGDFPSL